MRGDPMHDGEGPIRLPPFDPLAALESAEVDDAGDGAEAVPDEEERAESEPDLDVDEIAAAEAAAAQAAVDEEFLDQGVLELLGIYLHEVRRVPLLTAEEEIVLSRAYDEGRAAQARLRRDCPADEDESGRLGAVVRAGERARRRLVESN